ncbi:DUF1080 domain-containing protein, partial [Mariniblastus sp.]|nr:DUF1080 domain-containing protein [Mariniblastus sp.]
MKTKSISIKTLIGILIVSACLYSNDESTFVRMFNGKDLTGWTALPGGNWEVKNGIIIGSSTAAEERHGML